MERKKNTQFQLLAFDMEERKYPNPAPLASLSHLREGKSGITKATE